MTLPTINTHERLIHGTILKCIDGHWSADNETMNGASLLALHLTRAARHRIDNEIVRTICEDHEELPDIEKLNAAIPEDQWRVFHGTPQPPWTIEHVVYLLDPNDASLFTYLNNTYGAKRAWERLRDKITWMRAMRGEVLPIVELGSAVLKTDYGKKIGPSFKPINWLNLNASESPPRISGDKPAAAIGKPVAPVPAKEEVSDQIPF
jgi:hypothetical protein